MRIPFLRAKPEAEPPRAAPRRTERARGVAPASGAADASAARTRARQRLVGALVLLLLGVVGFPMLFETQPRPLPLDIPIRVAPRPGAEVTPALPGPTRRPLPVTSLPADMGSEAVVVPQPTAPASSPVAAVPVVDVVTEPAAKAAVAMVASAPPRAVAAAASRAALAAPVPVPVREPASAAATSGRFVVQVGAYTDARTLKEARGKVEKLSLPTYTQVIDSDAGKRTRLRAGPYTSRAEAEAAADKLKRAGLPANILAL